MYALQQVKNGQRTGKVWMFANRKLAQDSVVKTYETPDPKSLSQAEFVIKADYVQVITNYMGTIHFVINEVSTIDSIIYLAI